MEISSMQVTSKVEETTGNDIKKDQKTKDYTITIDTDNNSESKPNSLKLDSITMQHWQRSFEKINLQGLTDVMQDLIASLNSIPNIEHIAKKMYLVLQRITELEDDELRKLKELKQSEGWKQLKPYIEKELKKPEYNGITLDELTTNPDKNNRPPIDLLYKAIIAAKTTQITTKLPKIIITKKGINNIEYPLDKVNINIWTKNADKIGQLKFAAEKRGSKQTADIIYSINFEKLEHDTGITINKRLTAFDKRCYIAISALFNNGFKIVTVAQIYTTMGNIGRPSTADIKKINDSLTKMQAAHIHIDNEGEHKLYPKYSKFIYDANLLPIERISAVVNNKIVNSATHLFREPPLMSFAKKRKQITTISRQLLTSPISKTDSNLQLDDYLIERISHIKRSKGKLTNKLLYTTIYKNVNITTKMQRNRVKEKIMKYLEHYKCCGFIKNYKEISDGITITC